MFGAVWTTWVILGVSFNGETPPTCGSHWSKSRRRPGTSLDKFGCTWEAVGSGGCEGCMDTQHCIVRAAETASVFCTNELVRSRQSPPRPFSPRSRHRWEVCRGQHEGLSLWPFSVKGLSLWPGSTARAWATNPNVWVLMVFFWGGLFCTELCTVQKMLFCFLQFSSPVL